MTSWASEEMEKTRKAIQPSCVAEPTCDQFAACVQTRLQPVVAVVQPVQRAEGLRVSRLGRERAPGERGAVRREQVDRDIAERDIDIGEPRGIEGRDETVDGCLAVLPHMAVELHRRPIDGALHRG